MPRIPGIQIEKDSKGRPAYARINLKKHPEAVDLLNKIGAVEQDNFDKKWDKGITGDELMGRLSPRIKKLFKK